MRRTVAIFGLVMLCLLTGTTGAQQPTSSQPVDEDEQIDTALRKFGYTSGHAFQCYTGEQAAKARRGASARQTVGRFIALATVRPGTGSPTTPGSTAG